MLPNHWIEDVMAWRKAILTIKTSKPFILGPVLHNCYFLLGETGELLNAVFNHVHGKEYLRNPDSDRGAVVDELGDCLLMLATIAGQTGRQQLREIQFAYRDSPVKVARLLTDVANTLCVDAEDNNVAGNYTTIKMDRYYSLILILAEALQIDPAMALQTSSNKITARVRKSAQ